MVAELKAIALKNFLVFKRLKKKKTLKSIQLFIENASFLRIG